VVVVLSQTKSLFFCIEPFYVDWPISAVNDLALETVDGLLCVIEGPELDKSTTHEFLIFFHKFNIKNKAISLEKLPDLILIPHDRQIADIDNKLDSFSSKFIPGGNGTVRTISGLGGVAFVEFLVGSIGVESFAGVFVFVGRLVAVVGFGFGVLLLLVVRV
jgi:hypothetical protein